MGVINFSKVVKKNLQDPTEPHKTYAESQSRGRMDVDKLAQHMASHNTPFTRGTIKGIIEDFIDCVRELILDGWIVDLGNMGTFNVSLKSKGVAESVVDKDTKKKPVFSASDITAVNCLYVPGPAFENMIDDVTFNEVETLEKQAAHIKAKKLAIANGTWNPKTDNGGSTTGGSTGGGGGQGGGTTPNPDEGNEHE